MLILSNVYGSGGQPNIFWEASNAAFDSLRGLHIKFNVLLPMFTADSLTRAVTLYYSKLELWKWLGTNL